MATEQRKLQIPVEVDSTGAKQGFSEVKAAAQDMAQAVQQSGAQASKGVDGIGAGAPVASQKVDAATRSIIGSIQRTTAVMEAGGRTTSKYYEALAAQRGVSVEALKPYLTQLDAVTAKQAQATGALNAGAVGLNAVGMSAKQTAQAMRQVPMQFTDIWTSLASGQRPLQVMLQQGGQIKDMFGGIAPAARALGGYVLGLVNPFTLAAGAVGVLAYAYSQGSKEADAYAKALILSGNAAGTSVSRMQEMARAVDSVTGTQAAAADAIARLAGTGKVASENLQQFATVALNMERTLGVSVAETVKQFEDLAKSPADASRKLSESANFLTAALYEQIVALEAQGRASEAAAVAQRAYAEAMDVASARMEGNLGTIERAWLAVKNGAKEAWDVMLGVGRRSTLADQLREVQAEIAKARQPFDASAFGGNAEARARLPQNLAQEASLQEMIRMEKRGAELAAERTRQERAGIEFARIQQENRSKQQKTEEEIAKVRRLGLEAGKSELEIEKQVAAIREKNKVSGAAGTGQNEVAGIRARIIEEERELSRLRAGGVDAKQTEGEKLVLKIQQELQTSISGVARAEKEKALAAAQSLASVQTLRVAEEQRLKGLKDSEAALNKQIDAMATQADRALEVAMGQEAANAALGKSKTAIQEIALAQERANLAEAESSDRFAPAYVAAMARKVEAQERYVAALKEAEAKQLSLANSEWARTVEEEAKTLGLEVSLLGQTQQQREVIIAQRRVELDLAKRIAEIEKSGASPERKAALIAEAEGTALAAKSNAAQRAVLDEWNRTTQSINNSLTDALLRGFESGKGFAENLRDTLKNMFQTLVLRPTISAVLAPVSGALGGMFSSNAMAGQSGGGLLGGLGSMFGGGGGGFPSAGSFMSDGIGGIAGNLGTFGSGMSAGFGGLSGMFGANAAGTTFMGTLDAGFTALGAGNVAGGLGTLAGALGPLAMVGLPLLGGLFKKGGGPKVEGFAGTGISTKTNAAGASLAPIVAQYEAQFDAAMRAFGGSASAQFGLASVMDPKGTAPSFVGTAATVNGRQVRNVWDREVGRDEEAVQAAIDAQMKETLVAALRAADLPGTLGDLLRRDMTVSAERVSKIVAERTSLDARLTEMTTSALEKLNAARKAERDAIDETNRALLAQVHAQEDVLRAGNDLIEAFAREQGALKDYARALRDFVNGLMQGTSSPLSATARTTRAGGQFDTTLAQARAGDQEARARLTSVSGDFLNAAMNSAGSRAEFDAIFARVAGALTVEAASAESQATLQEKDFEVQKAQLSALGLLNQNVMTFSQAMANYLNAQSALDQAKQTVAAETSSYVPAPPPPPGVDPWEAEFGSDPALLQRALQYKAAGYDIQMTRLLLQYASGQGIGQFASGGIHLGGMRLVGEQGPELEVTGPARIYSASQTRELLKGISSGAQASEAMRELLAEMKAARLEARTGDAAAVTQLSKMTAMLNKWDRQGNPPVREEVVA